MTRRFAVVALIGAPNAGKSTLLNRLVGAKVSIVTHKVQTTRAKVRGIAIEGESQLVYVDTPGIFAPKRRLDRAMIAAAWQGVADADFTVLLHDARRSEIDAETAAILDGLKGRRGRHILALNKIDTLKPEQLLSLAERFSAAHDFEQVFMISALNGDGVADMSRYLAKEAEEGPWHFPEDQLSDLPQRLLAAEVLREKLFLALHQELPYALTVETETWEDFDDGSVKIEQVVYVQRDAHKKIAIGRGGETIRGVREAAQRELEAMFETKVHLFVFVKVRERWLDDPERYRLWGLDFSA
ncbi:MAG: GTPase Era [Rhodovibrionaceae bacterium]